MPAGAATVGRSALGAHGGAAVESGGEELVPATTEAITHETLTHDTASGVHRTAEPARTCERGSRPSGRALVLIALAALVLGACGGSDDDPGDVGKRAAERYDVKALAKAPF